MAYAVKAGDKSFVVVDGKKGTLYDEVILRPPAFSPNSRRIAFAAKTAEKWFAIVDGKEGRPCDRIAQLVVAGYNPTADEYSHREQIGKLTFSPNSQRAAYVVGIGEDNLVVIDEEGGSWEDKPHHGMIGDLIFSPDSKHLAYLVENSKKQEVFVDGKEVDSPIGLNKGGLTFSPDSQYVDYILGDLPMYYMAGANSKWGEVLNGKEEKKFYGAGTLVFSADGQHLAYAAEDTIGERRVQFVVLDGNELTPYYGVDNRSITFSPDSSRLAYSAIKTPLPRTLSTHTPALISSFTTFKTQALYVLDGKAGKPYDEVGGLARIIREG